jgi:hypothetical protein
MLKSIGNGLLCVEAEAQSSAWSWRLRCNRFNVQQTTSFSWYLGEIETILGWYSGSTASIDEPRQQKKICTSSGQAPGARMELGTCLSAGQGPGSANRIPEVTPYVLCHDARKKLRQSKYCRLSTVWYSWYTRFILGLYWCYTRVILRRYPGKWTWWQRLCVGGLCGKRARVCDRAFVCGFEERAGARSTWYSDFLRREFWWSGVEDGRAARLERAPEGERETTTRRAVEFSSVFSPSPDQFCVSYPNSSRSEGWTR